MKIILTILTAFILSGCYTQLHIVETSPNTQVLHRTNAIIHVHSQTPYIYYHPSTVIYYPPYRTHTTIIVVTPQPNKVIQQPRSSGVSRTSQNTERTQRNRNN
jgi:hypothetical protein